MDVKSIDFEICAELELDPGLPFKKKNEIKNRQLVTPNEIMPRNNSILNLLQLIISFACEDGGCGFQWISSYVLLK